MLDIKKMIAQMTYKLRGDTEQNWNNINPILATREPALVLDENGKTIGFKIGDGVTHWNNLDFYIIDGNNGTIKLWQSNTEYKVGDTVIATLAHPTESDYAYTACLVCIKNHTSGPASKPNVVGDFNGCWDIYEMSGISSVKAYCDGSGNNIANTYVTKVELGNSYITASHISEAYVHKEDYAKDVGNIETVLDNIVTIQESLIGGGNI